MCAELPCIHLQFVTNTILYLNVHRPCLLLLITWNWHLHHLFITGCLAWLMVFMMKSKLYRWKRMLLSRWTTSIPSEKEKRVTNARYFKFTGVSIIFFLSFFLFIFFKKIEFIGVDSIFMHLFLIVVLFWIQWCSFSLWSIFLVHSLAIVLPFCIIYFHLFPSLSCLCGNCFWNIWHDDV